MCVCVCLCVCYHVTHMYLHSYIYTALCVYTCVHIYVIKFNCTCIRLKNMIHTIQVTWITHVFQSMVSLPLIAQKNSQVLILGI